MEKQGMNGIPGSPKRKSTEGVSALPRNKSIRISKENCSPTHSWLSDDLIDQTVEICDDIDSDSDDESCSKGLDTVLKSPTFSIGAAAFDVKSISDDCSHSSAMSQDVLNLDSTDFLFDSNQSTTSSTTNGSMKLSPNRRKMRTYRARTRSKQMQQQFQNYMKTSALYKSAQFSCKGKRTTMEDTIQLLPFELPCVEAKQRDSLYCGVFDGHNGDFVSKILQTNLHEKIIHNQAMREGNVPEAIRIGFALMEQEIFKTISTDVHKEEPSKQIPTRTLCRTKKRKENSLVPTQQLEKVGSTAVISLLVPCPAQQQSDTFQHGCCTAVLHVGWVGDSRLVLCKNGKAVPITTDHVASNPVERARIISSGGIVDGTGRLFGDIAVSRAFGNFFYKANSIYNSDQTDSILLSMLDGSHNDVSEIINQLDLSESGPNSIIDEPMDQNLLIANPEIKSIPIYDTEDEFIILASDGLWTVFSNQEAVDFVKNSLKTQTLDVAAQLLTEAAINRGSSDNISVVVTNLKRNKK